MELKGNGFVLRNWQLQDAPALQKHADNVKIAACLLDRFPSPYTLADAEFFINLKINEDKVANLPIVINNEVCGVIGIDNLNEVDETPLIGYWLSEQYWGRGIATEAVKLFAGYAFKNLELTGLNAEVSGINPASMRVLEKAGFVEIAVLKDGFVKRDGFFDKHVYTLSLASR
jgi:ribosomal-protein-alanine N-acetyltransferase